MEWRSLLRHIAAAPALEWERWMALKSAAQELLGRVATPAFFDFPPLLATQQRRLEHLDEALSRSIDPGPGRRRPKEQEDEEMQAWTRHA